jgi:mTERF domain-containing protein
LLQDADKQVRSVVNYLTNNLGIFEDDLPKVLQLYPMLLGVEINRMRNVADFLLALEVAEENLASIFRAFPVLLTMDVEAMQPVIDFLQNEIGIANVGRFVTRLPPVLGYSVEFELQPKWDFLNSISLDARFEVSKFPAYFSYPLEKCIKSRYEYLLQVKGVPQALLQADKVLCFGDKDFARKVARDADQGRTYRLFVEARQAQLSEDSSRFKEVRKGPNNVMPQATS